MKTLKFFMALLTLSMVMACSEDNTSGERMDNSDKRDVLKNGLNDDIKLTGTKWKLAALVDIQTRESIEPEPKECDACYTLEFDSDTTAIGLSVLNVLNFIVTPSSIKPLGMTKIWDGENNNVDLFYYAFQTLDTTYEYSENELKIYYEEKKKYLLYKPLLQLPEEKPKLTGTKWKLAALVDVQTRESIEPEPKECDACYTLEFDSDTTAVGRSVGNVQYYIVAPSNIKMVLTTEMWDGENNNVNLFYEAFLTLDAYEYSKDELKIYYEEKKKYLFYKPLLQ
ncbi:MAG: hypothetical protein LBS25_03730 [Candidatus Symbiothrix sp.]|jgi:hypothetical protein|nr:hypothetical protein [Candidatus Symbiothrix sp.]